MVKTGHSPRYMAIAAPDRIEWVPTSSFLIPSLSSPTDSTAACRACTISLDEMCSILLFLQTADTGVSLRWLRQGSF